MPIFDESKGKLICRTKFKRPISLKANESLNIIRSSVEYLIEYDSFKVIPNNDIVKVVFLKDGVEVYIHDCARETAFHDVDGTIVFSCTG